MIPTDVIDCITTIIRRFVWGSKSCPVAWKKVCKSKEEGGLALRDLSTWNKALMAKNLWNIQAKFDSLWIQWIRTEFLRGKTIWEWRATMRDSLTIKNILGLRDRILNDCGGDQIKVSNLVQNWASEGGVAAAYDHLREKIRETILAQSHLETLYPSEMVDLVVVGFKGPSQKP